MPDRADLRRTVVIADDHAIVRRALADILSLIPDLEVAGEASNGVEAIAAAKTHRPDLMTLDAGMPLSNGMEVFAELRRWSPGTRIAVVTGFTAAGLLADWLAAGVDGLVLKSSDPETMCAGLRAVLEGGTYVDPAAQKLIDAVGPRESLTRRERQILHMVAAGRTNGEIGERLSIAPKTVENHRTRMMAKLDVHSVAQLVAYALREGLLENAFQS